MRFLRCSVPLLLVLLWLPAGQAQEPLQDAAQVPTPAPANAPADKIRVSTVSSAIRRHKQDAWSVLGIAAVNRTGADGEALHSIYFPPNSARQFARRMWVPANARRSSWLPIKLPGNIEGERQAYKALSLDVADGRELLQAQAGGQLTADEILSIDRLGNRTATILRQAISNESNLKERQDKDVDDTILAAHLALNLPRATTDLTADFLPPFANCLESLDHIVMSSDQIQTDAAGQESLRDWVRNGGKLWITLDRVQPETVAAIIGNAIELEVVDRVELDRYSLDTVPEAGRKLVQDACEYEVPVDLVRVVTSATDIQARVNGWPAAIWVPYGDGEVLLTTLAVRGWRPEQGEGTTAGLYALAQRFFVAREGELPIAEFRPALEQQIGYHIPRRSFAITMLGGYCVALLVLGLVLARQGRLDWLAGLVPVLTLVVAAVLMGVGASNATSVRPTIAYMQLLRFGWQTNEASVKGLAAIYDQQSQPISLSTQQRTWLIPDAQDSAEVRRQTWTDDDGMHTQNLTTNAGSVGLTSVSGTVALPVQVAATAMFGPDGLQGKLNVESFQDVADPVLAGPPAPASALKLAADGSFVARPNDVLAADQYSDAVLLSDEQRRRQEIYRTLLAPADAHLFPQRPSLLFWSQPLALASQFPDGFDVTGSALSVVALHLQRTPPDSPFQVPATFLRTTVAQGRFGSSNAYQPRTGKWLTELTAPTETLLRFQLPEQVLPCQLNRGRLTVRLNAPSRDLTVWAYGGAEPVLIQTNSNPTGVVEVDLDADDLILDELGGVKLAVAVGALQTDKKADSSSESLVVSGDSTNLTATWHIDYVRLTVGGKTN